MNPNSNKYARANERQAIERRAHLRLLRTLITTGTKRQRTLAHHALQYVYA